MQNVSPLNIFIVDDDLVTQYGARIRIQQTGIQCRVRCFDDAHDLLMEFAGRKSNGNDFPDIIILDLRMPRMGGWEFLERFGALEGLVSFPRIYIVSSFETTEDVERAKNHPMVCGYYKKPLRIENLLHMITAIEQEKEF